MAYFAAISDTPGDSVPDIGPTICVPRRKKIATDATNNRLARRSSVPL